MAWPRGVRRKRAREASFRNAYSRPNSAVRDLVAWVSLTVRSDCPEDEQRTRRFDPELPYEIGSLNGR